MENCNRILWKCPGVLLYQCCWSEECRMQLEKDNRPFFSAVLMPWETAKSVMNLLGFCTNLNGLVQNDLLPYMFSP